MWGGIPEFPRSRPEPNPPSFFRKSEWSTMRPCSSPCRRAKSPRWNPPTKLSRKDDSPNDSPTPRSANKKLPPTPFPPSKDPNRNIDSERYLKPVALPKALPSSKGAENKAPRRAPRPPKAQSFPAHPPRDEHTETGPRLPPERLPNASSHCAPFQKSWQILGSNLDLVSFPLHSFPLWVNSTTPF